MAETGKKIIGTTLGRCFLLPFAAEQFEEEGLSFWKKHEAFVTPCRPHFLRSGYIFPPFFFRS